MEKRSFPIAGGFDLSCGTGGHAEFYAASSDAHGNPLPPEAWKFAASIPKMADATLEKWEEYAQPYM